MTWCSVGDSVLLRSPFWGGYSGETVQVQGQVVHVLPDKALARVGRQHGWSARPEHERFGLVRGEYGWWFAPDQCTFLPAADSAASRVDEHAARKAKPVFRGVLAYFPDALAEVAHLSLRGNEQHNAGQPLHWAFAKSADHGDCLLRHQADYDEQDSDGVLHAAKVAWRALAQLQTLLERRDVVLHERREAQRARSAKGER